ncbi:MATE family efflux transporter [Pelagibius sp. Alg239-R121]|uniref:MATE family efflux transporter n=1 Tax=Pelagibius sp. Alg239-R121 TaxID=2993448 RepID=UPI0024A688CA|nr:MATE family efflux transporter [Pelagibius sp. Alg239-R121]
MTESGAPANSGPQTTARLTQGPTFRHILGLTLPMVWGLFATIGFNVADTFFVAQLGTTQLAAISFTFPVVMVLISLAIGLGAGASAVVARAIGQNDRGKVEELATDSLLLAAAVVSVFVVVGLLTIDPLFRLLGAEEALLPLIRDYMEIWYLGIAFLVIPMVGNNVIRASGDARFPSLIMVIAALVNIALDPLLIFGLAGFPRLELQGAAIATVISRAITFFAAIAVLHYRERLIRWSKPEMSKVLASWRSILHVGLPAAGTQMINPMAVAVITRFVAAYGSTAVAGFGLATRLEALSLVFLFALSSSTGPIVGQNLGAGLVDRIRSTLRESYLLSFGWGAVAAVILGFYGPALAGLFDDDPSVIAIARDYLIIVPVSYGCYGAVMVAGAGFNALGRPLSSTILTLLRMIVLYIPVAFVAGELYGIVGIFVAAAFANLTTGIVSCFWTSRACNNCRQE